MALPDYRVVVNTFEAKPWPVHTHIFHGETLEEAMGHYRRRFKKPTTGKVKVFFQKRASKKDWLTLKSEGS